METLLKKIWRFYAKECCWPYGLSFYLVLLIFFIDFILSPRPQVMPSVFAYGVIASYYFQNIRYYRSKILVSEDPLFFIGFLSFKIMVWGCILVLLLFRSKNF
ncbi:MAG: hypothetical protein HQM09_19810 [Candidatus Riflebacteria bacterium]|nr:hypothetical protein [Candidatus Riflebacteria bacterium]